jgi:hypothetical protein
MNEQKIATLGNDLTYMIDYAGLDETEIRTISVYSPRATCAAVSWKEIESGVVPQKLFPRRKMGMLENMKERKNNTRMDSENFETEPVLEALREEQF